MNRNLFSPQLTHFHFAGNQKSGNAWSQQRRLCNRTDFKILDSSLVGLAESSFRAGIHPREMDADLRIVEAILMIAKEPLSARKLAGLAELEDPTRARSLARLLNEKYDSCGHSFRIEEIAGGMQFLTRPQFASWLRRLDHVPGEMLLSKAMLETLSIVAYRQPILRAEIETIRGVGCDEVLRQLMQRDFVRICGRHEELGRPYLYGTTRRFLEMFGLQSLDSLPRAQKIRRAEAETASRLAGNLSQEEDNCPENRTPSNVSTKTDH